MLFPSLWSPVIQDTPHQKVWCTNLKMQTLMPTKIYCPRCHGIVSACMDESVDDNWMKPKDVIITIANDCIPHTTLKLKRTKNWLSDKTLSAIKKKRRLYRRAKRSGKPNDLNRYRAFSNTVRKLTRQDHHSHVDHISTELLNTGNQKPFWRWLKTLK